MVTGSPTFSNTVPNPLNLPSPYNTSSNIYISLLLRPTKFSKDDICDHEFWNCACKPGGQFIMHTAKYSNYSYPRSHQQQILHQRIVDSGGTF